MLPEPSITNSIVGLLRATSINALAHSPVRGATPGVVPPPVVGWFGLPNPPGVAVVPEPGPPRFMPPPAVPFPRPPVVLRLRGVEPVLSPLQPHNQPHTLTTINT